VTVVEMMATMTTIILFIVVMMIQGGYIAIHNVGLLNRSNAIVKGQLQECL
jgi:hypothetical protein